MATERPWITPEGEQLLRRAARAIVRHPERYQQGVWHCGTACCIAGHVVLASGLATHALESSEGLYRPAKHRRAVPIPRQVTRHGMNSWEFLALRALGYVDRRGRITKHGRRAGAMGLKTVILPVRSVGISNVFDLGHLWVEPFGEAFASPRVRMSSAKRAKLAAKRIEHFIDTGA